MSRVYRKEYLVLDEGPTLAVYGPSDLPAGTVVGRDARRLRVTGPEPARPTAPHLAPEAFEGWLRSLRAGGFEAIVEPFWERPEPGEIGPSQPLDEVRDELFRLAHGRR